MNKINELIRNGTVTISKELYASHIESVKELQEKLDQRDTLIKEMKVKIYDLQTQAAINEKLGSRTTYDV